MKSLNNFIKESASIFADSYGGYNDIASNYLEYFDGDKTFGELKSGDIVYYYSYDYDEESKDIDIVEVTVRGRINKRNNTIYLPVNKFESYKGEKTKYQKSILEFGPSDSGKMGADDEGIVRDYSPENVEKSSICVSFGDGYAFGTNKENVLKYAKKDITKSIQKIQDKINKLQTEIESLNKKLENIK